MSLPTSSRYIVASLGSIGQRHLRNLRLLRPDAEITALRRPHSVSVGAAEERVSEVTSIEAALDLKPDAVILAGPAPTHVPLAQRFAENGIPVLVEKPLSNDLEGLGTLARIAREKCVPIMVAYNMRFNKALQAVRNELRSGVIGEVMAVRAEVGQYLPDWRPQADYREAVSAKRSLGGGPLLELSHEIDFLYWLFGMPQRVTSLGGRYSSLEIDVEDCVELWLEYDSPSRIVSLHLDFLQRPAARSCKFIGTKGTLTWDSIENSYSVNIADPVQNRRTLKISSENRNQMYLDELSSFLSVIEQHREPAIPLSSGIDVMRIIFAASKSLVSGRAESPIDVRDLS